MDRHPYIDTDHHAPPAPHKPPVSEMESRFLAAVVGGFTRGMYQWYAIVYVHPLRARAVVALSSRAFPICSAIPTRAV
jgi:hypothetical protein